METVREFENQHPDIIVDRAEYVLEVIDLLLVGLGDGRHQRSDVSAEALAYLLYRVVSVLHHIVQQGRSHDSCIFLPHFFYYYYSHRKGVKYIRNPALTFLWAVCLLGQSVCIPDKGLIFLRTEAVMPCGLKEMGGCFFYKLRVVHKQNLNDKNLPNLQKFIRFRKFLRVHIE